jgi:hypothetical protein
MTEFTVPRADDILSEIDDKDIRRMVETWNADLRAVDSAIKDNGKYIKDFLGETDKLLKQASMRMKAKETTPEERKMLEQLLEHALDVRKSIARVDAG